MSIPLTQLGERAFNPNRSTDDDVEAEYDRLRDAAREEAKNRNKCFQQAHEAYERGDGAEAKNLSNAGKRHASKMDDYNRQASEFIFRENNADSAGDEIDLHGQFVEEAEDILEGRIKASKQRGESHLHVIVGKGNHSTGHVQKLKPKMEKVCQELGVKYHTEENEGRIYVDLGGSGGGHGGYQPQPGGGHNGAYPGGPQHGGGQSHGGQHHGGQQQEDNLGNLLADWLPKALGKCCVVM